MAKKRTICIEGGKKVDNNNLQDYEKLGDKSRGHFKLPQWAKLIDWQVELEHF